MSMYNDFKWGAPGNGENCMAISMNVAAYANKFPQGCCHFWDLVLRKSGTRVNKPNGEWSKIAEVMVLNFAESGHPVFRATSASGRGELKGKGSGKMSIHFNGSEETVDLILRTVISLNQFSIYGAVEDLRTELDPDSRNRTKGEICESFVIPTEITNAYATSQSSTSLAQRGLLQEYERKFAELPDC